jgi:hypothetical protein
MIDNFLFSKLANKKSFFNKIYNSLFSRTNWNKRSVKSVAIIASINSYVSSLINIVTGTKEAPSVPEIFAGEVVKFIAIKEQKYLTDNIEAKTTEQVTKVNNFVKKLTSEKISAIVKI